MTSNTMQQKLKTLVTLSPAQWLMLCEAWLLFIVWDRRLRTKAYNTWRESISNLGSNNKSSVSLNRVLAIVKAAEIAGRNHIVKVNCLRRCLTQKQMLMKRNIPVSIHFGVRLSAGKVDAHCWLIWNGVIINDAPEVVESYSELKEINPSSLAALLSSAS